MPQKPTKVALVIPAYNEALSIKDLIDEIHRLFKATDYDYRVIVVDDGSKDETATLVGQCNAHLIKHILNSGSGSATATGLSYAQQNGYTMAVTLDGDGQHHPADALKGLEVLSKSPNTDLLIGSRLINKGGMSRTKVIGNKGLSFVTYLLFGVNVTDSQSGMRVFSERALSALKWKTNGYEYASEMLWRAKQQGLTIAEYPIQTIYTEYSKSKGQNNWNGFVIVKELLQRRIVELFDE